MDTTTPTASPAELLDSHQTNAAAAATAAPYPREALLKSVKRQRQRETYSWSLPVAVISYILFCVSLVLHSQVESAYEMETGLLLTFTAAETGRLQGVPDIWSYLQGGALAAAFPPGDAATIGAAGTINRYATILGGVRLGQSRSVVAECAFQAVFHRFGAQCHPARALSTAPYGNRSVTDAAGVTPAFLPAPFSSESYSSGSAGSVGTADSFEFVLPSNAGPAAAAALIEGLIAGEWIDVSTLAVHVEVAVFNLEVAAWSRVLVTVTLTRGGRISSDVVVQSVPIDPYYTTPALRMFDILNGAYLLLLLLQNAFNVAGAVSKGLRRRSEGETLYSSVAGAAEGWLAVDVGASLSLLVTAVLWGTTVSALTDVQNAVSSASVFSDPAALAADTASVQRLLNAALGHFADFKRCGVATLVFLTLRLFWQFSLQPRLAVLTESLSRAASDVAHFGFLFGVILVSYCVWGHVVFGPQLADWRSFPLAAFAVVRFAMYDYDYPGMSAVDADGAAIFYGSFMFLITNMLLWMFLAIVMETYSAVRLETRGTPSALADLVSGTLALPARLKVLMNDSSSSSSADNADTPSSSSSSSSSMPISSGVAVPSTSTSTNGGVNGSDSSSLFAERGGGSGSGVKSHDGIPLHSAADSADSAAASTSMVFDVRPLTSSSSAAAAASVQLSEAAAAEGGAASASSSELHQRRRATKDVAAEPSSVSSSSASLPRPNATTTTAVAAADRIEYVNRDDAEDDAGGGAAGHAHISIDGPFSADSAAASHQQQHSHAVSLLRLETALSSLPLRLSPHVTLHQMATALNASEFDVACAIRRLPDVSPLRGTTTDAAALSTAGRRVNAAAAAGEPASPPSTFSPLMSAGAGFKAAAARIAVPPDLRSPPADSTTATRRASAPDASSFSRGGSGSLRRRGSTSRNDDARESVETLDIGAAAAGGVRGAQSDSGGNAWKPF